MSDALCAYLREHELGDLRDHVELGGDFPGERGGLQSLLATTDRGTYLVGTSEGVAHAHLDLGQATELGYRSAMLGDTLEVAGASLSVPTRKSGRVLDAIATARVLGAEPLPTPPLGLDSSFCESVRRAESAWISRWLQPQERLLAWLHTDEVRPLPSSIIMGETTAPLRYVLSDRRHALVGVSPVGDLVVETLPWSSLAVERSVMRGGVVTGPATWKTTRGNAATHQALQAVPGTSPEQAAREVARLLWRSDGREAEDVSRARDLLGTQPGDALSVLSLEWVLEASTQEGPPDFSEAAIAALAELQTLPKASAVLANWAAQWAVPRAHQRVLVEGLRTLGRAHAALALELHARLHATASADEQSIEADHRLGEHMLEVEEPQQAAAVLRSTLERLPSAGVYELIAPQREDEQADTEDERAALGGRLARIATLEILVTATRGTDPTAWLRELAALEPLNPRRFVDLAEHLEGHPEPADLDLWARANAVARLLTDPEAFCEDERSLSPEVCALERRDIDERLRHPEARDGGLMAKLQTMLANISIPDSSAIKAYCERAQLKAYPELDAAMTAATVVLGVPAMLAYVSRGEKSIGMRAYEGEPPFLVVGGEHLDPQADAYLAPSALRFAVGAELAHLRLAHSRVTSAEVWAGGLELGVEGLGVVFAAAPLLAKVYNTTLGKILGTLGTPIVERVRGSLRTHEKPSRGSLSHDGSELVAAHRVMQFTADRAGLLLASSPAAAIRAMFAGHPASLAKWALVRRRPLVEVLLRGEDASQRDQLLAVRVAAMLAFFVSSDFATLRGAIRPASQG